MTTKTIASFVLALILTALATTARAEIVTVDTAAGPIKVSSSIAPRMKAFIADLVTNGFHGRIGCLAHGGHVPGSRHYSGNACDFETDRGKYPHPMLRKVADLAAKHGLRDGCTFNDCGHIDDGQQLARSYQKTRYTAKRSYMQHASYATLDKHQTY